VSGLFSRPARTGGRQPPTGASLQFLPEAAIAGYLIAMQGGFYEFAFFIAYAQSN